MVKGLKEMEFIKETFGRFVSPEVANEVLKGKLSLGTESRVISVLFVDIKGFTRLSEKLAARQVVDLLNRYFSLMGRIVFKHGGIINKFIGDAMLIVFGTPLEQPDHAKRAISTSREMMEELKSFNEERRKKGESEINISY